MGRRTIKNVDTKIMDEVIKENFRYGIASISTKDLARRIHISEPVIFAHFKTKQNLMNRTFEYAWSKVPERAIFPTPDIDINDPKVYQVYVARFQELLSRPKEVVYGDSYYHSSYYDFSLAYEVEKNLVDRLIAVFKLYHTGRSDEERKIMVMQYLENMVASLSRMARGITQASDENLRIVFGMLLFGSYGLLTEYKTI
jgi:AcrR family transcriptional regulator